MSSEEFNGTVFDRIENCNESRTTVLQDVQCGVSPDEYAFVEKLCKSYEPLHAVEKRFLSYFKYNIIRVQYFRLYVRED